MLLKVKALYLLAGKPVAILHEETARKLNLRVSDRIRIKNKGRKIVAPIDIVSKKTVLNRNEIALSQEIMQALNLKRSALIEINPALKPLSTNYILKKLHCKELSYTEIYSIISGIINNELTEAEIAYYVSGVYLNGMNLNEIISLTKAMVATGNQLHLKNKIVVDKHSISGVAGNRTTPIVTSIIGAFIDKFHLDAVMPKTSSRAITSAAGTADVIETLAKVDFSAEEMKKIIQKTNACLVWGGSLRLAPADDKIIQIERVLNLDPQAQLIASILSKKLTVNATHVLIDIPYGKYTKMKTFDNAVALKKKFDFVAKHFKLNLRCLITKGEEPIGRGMGPVLEMRDVISVLRQDNERPLDLERKSVFLASEIISFLGMPRHLAFNQAKELLESEAAFQKFGEIIKAQGGNLSDLDEKLKLGKFKAEINAHKTGKITSIDGKKITSIARMAGCPADKSAGLFLQRRLGEQVKKGEPLFVIYAETKDKLDYAKLIAERTMPMAINGG